MAGECHQFEARGRAIDTLWAHLPMGKAWHAFYMTGKVAYKLWQGFADGFNKIDEAICKLAYELDPRVTTELLPEYETATSLPDPCLPTTATLQERRDQVMFRLDKRRWTTAQDWKDLAALFGLQIVITPGWLVQKPALYAFSYPKRYDLFPKLGRFRVYIDIMNIEFGGYPYDGTSILDHQYPILYGADSQAYSAFQCLIERVKPANVIVIWNAFPEIPGTCRHPGTFTDEFTDEFC